VKATAFPGLVDALERLRDHGIPMAVAASGQPQKIRSNLEQAGITEFFRRDQGGQSVSPGSGAAPGA
jgi:beta-phosphoglucomutase-like phosphatase (HAD superfamily)